MGLRYTRIAAAFAGLLALPAAVAIALPGGSASANRGSAETEAVRLLALVQLPPGAAGAASEPTGDRGALSQPTLDEATPNLVDRSAWWTTTASAAVVLAYVAAHLRPGAKEYTRGFGEGAVPVASETFALAPVPGILTQRVLGVTTATLPGGVTGVRTDGEAVWLTPRPAWEQVPSAVRRVTFTARGADDHGHVGPSSTPRTLTGVRARRLVAFINAAEIVQPGVASCPAAFDESVSLRFIGGGGRTLARATENPTGCASVTLTIGRRTGPALTDYPSVTDELVRLGAVPVCAGRDLSPSVSPPGRSGATDARAIFFGFKNRSNVMCRLAGFPRLAWFDAAGRRVPITLTDQGASTVRHEGLAAVAVLDPGQSAGFGVTYTRCGRAREVVKAQVALPGVAGRFELALGSASQPFAPCHGAVRVGNL